MRGGDRMSRARRAFANRANARKSTGPQTRAGKAIVARNARRHGLSLTLQQDHGIEPEVEALARLIIGSIVGLAAEPRILELACRIAEAQLDLARIRRVRLPVRARLATEPAVARELLRLDYYERRALTRRKLALRAFDAALPPLPAGKAPAGEIEKQSQLG
jgi:hypothetical protein